MIAVLALGMLSYIQSEHFNIVQRVNTQFIFANNILKQFVESYYQMGFLVSYEFFRHGLQANTKVVIEEILEKTRTS